MESFVTEPPIWRETIAAVTGPCLLLLWYLWARHRNLLLGAILLAFATELLGSIVDTIRCGSLVAPRDPWAFGINLFVASVAVLILIRTWQRRDTPQ